MPAVNAAAPTRFTLEDVELFSQASHDRNPLHLSSVYARKTPYGERVVFGILGALACLARFEHRPQALLAQVAIDFSHPFFVGIDYMVDVLEDSPQRARAILRDGRRTLLKLNITYREGKPTEIAGTAGTGPRVEARDWAKADLVKDLAVESNWTPNADALGRLLERFQLGGKGGDDCQKAVLLYTSYLVGMELPGKRALFSRLALSFDPVEVSPSAGLSCQAQVKSVNPHFNLLTAGVRFLADGQCIASGEIAAFLREDTPAVDSAEWDRLLPRGDALRGKVGLVIGASRGLGSAITRGLCLQGCTVLANFATSVAEAEQLQDALRDAPGRVLLERGDATDPAWCAGLSEQIERTHGRLDFLVCNACPPLQASWLEPQAVGRIRDHINQSVALMLTPMSAFLKLLAEYEGCNVLISSAAVKRPVADWPHYVAAKCAIEGMAAVAALEFPRVRLLVARPPRLLTDLTNTPLGRQGALSPARVAARLVHILTGAASWPEPAPDGQVAYLEDF